MLMMSHPECKRLDALHELPPQPRKDRGILVSFWPDPFEEDDVRRLNRLLVQNCDYTVVGRNEIDIREALKGRIRSEPVDYEK